MTIDLVRPNPMTLAEAQDISERLRDAAERYATATSDVLVLLAEAKAGQAHIALGFDSWTAYLSDLLGREPLRLEREQRQELVAALADEGMTTRAIAPILGVDQKTVVRDLSAVEANASTASRTGLDGKTYQPHPKPPADVDSVAEAVAQFPVLTYYTEAGRAGDALRLAGALGGYSEPELSMRIANLEKTIAAEKRKAAEPAEPAEPDWYGLGGQIFEAVNNAAQVAARNGGPQTILEALDRMDPFEVDLWRDQFLDVVTVCTALAEACSPQLRRVK